MGEQLHYKQKEVFAYQQLLLDVEELRFRMLLSCKYSQCYFFKINVSQLSLQEFWIHKLV